MTLGLKGMGITTGFCFQGHTQGVFNTFVWKFSRHRLWSYCVQLLKPIHVLIPPPFHPSLTWDTVTLCPLLILGIWGSSDELILLAFHDQRVYSMRADAKNRHLCTLQGVHQEFSGTSPARCLEVTSHRYWISISLFLSKARPKHWLLSPSGYHCLQFPSDVLESVQD